MGLPIWRDPEEKVRSKGATKDPTAHLRSSIRRRVNDRRAHPPRFYRQDTEGRRGDHRGLPAIPSLIEATESQSPILPPSPPPGRAIYLPSPAVDDGDEAERMRRRQRRARARLVSSRHEREADHPARETLAGQEPLGRNRAFRTVHPSERLEILRSPRLTTGPNTRRNIYVTSELSSDILHDETPRAHLPPPPRRTWRTGALVSGSGGLGDRNRSPTPGDGWEIIRTTITPDETLPSAESSFASAAVSRSFNASGSSPSTHMTEPDGASLNSSRESPDHGVPSDSASSVDPDDLICNDEDLFRTEGFAEDVYYREMESPEGRERIAHHQRLREHEGNRFAVASEPPRVDVGFRLIEEALESEEGRERVLRIRNGTPDEVQNLETMLNASRRVRERRMQHHDRLYDDRPEDAPPGRYSEATHEAVRQAQREVESFFRRPRFGGVDTLESRVASPPSYWGALVHDEVLTSNEAAVPQPVSPPILRRDRELSEALHNSEVMLEELNPMRRSVTRMVEREETMLGQHDRFRTQPRRHGQESTATADMATALNNARSGRAQRLNSLS